MKAVTFRKFLSVLITTLLVTPRLVFASAINTSVSFDAGSNNFSFTVTTDQSVDYLLAYRTDKNVTQAAQGSGNPKTIYVGTCSTGGTCTPDHIVRGVLKTKVNEGNYLHAVWFTSSASLEVVHEEEASSLDLSSAETAFLENGALPQNNSPPVNGNLSTTILKNTSAPSLDLGSPTNAGSATVTTNKPDYSPNDTVIITGTNFIPNQEYTLYISSTDPPPVDFKASVTANATGSFVYAYQLDGNYRPNYKVEVKDRSGTIVASTTFTDSASPGVTVTAATGGSTISADTTGSSYTTLTGPTITEGGNKDVGTGTIVLNAPSGFKFNTGQTVTATISNTNSGNGACFTFSSTTATPLTGSITFTVSAHDDAQGPTKSLCKVVFSNIQVQPTSGTPLATGNITESETSSVSGVTGSTNFGTLTEVAGAKNKLAFTTQPSTTATVNTDFATKPVVTLQDQFGNTVTSDSTSTITRTAVLSTQECGGTAGSGTLTSSPANGAAVSSGVLTYTAMQYSSSESIKICATSAGVTSALSNSINVVAATGTLKIVKNTTGGNGTFNFTVTGPSASTPAITTSNGTGSSGPTTVNTGTYSAKETVPNGWSLTSASCDDGSSSFSVDTVSAINITAGKDVICTFNDSKLPTLTLTKTVNNTHGGTKTVSDFVLKIDGNAVTSGVVNTVSIGSHGVSEVNLAGYSPSAWGTNCAPDGTITLAAGDNKTCTITNDDIAPKLTVTKVVTNDNGGTKVIADFPLFVDDNPVVSGVQNTFNAGSHIISETSQSGYTGTISGDCASDGSITLNPGDVKSCTITNNDQPGEIHGIKFEDHNGNGIKDGGDNGLQGWTIFLDTNSNGIKDEGELSTTTDANGNYAVANLNVGTYKVREIFPAGWTQTTPNPADITLTNGQVVNDVNFGNFKKITISGQKFNDLNGNGVKEEGESGLSNWTINLTHNESTSSATTDVNGNYSFSNLGPGTYRVREVLQALWAQTSSDPEDITALSGANVSGVDFGNKEIPPQISEETSSSVGASSVTITWTTDHSATSRVIYDTVSHSVLGAAPNYGYANSTVEDTTKVTSHSVGLTGLSSGTTYYYRMVSHGSPEAVSGEKSFATGSVAAASTGGGGGGGGGAVSAPTCGDTKPGSAPTLTSAVAGTNGVTLFWTAASNPVTYYLATYGTSSGAQTYGNPNVGGNGTTSYTVSGLSGGTTYYFKVRAGNSCTPGDFSNELSATPTGGFVSGPAAGFIPGVLGVATPSANLASESGVLGTGSAEVPQIWWENGWLVFLIIALGGAAGFFLWRRLAHGQA